MFPARKHRVQWRIRVLNSDDDSHHWRRSLQCWDWKEVPKSCLGAHGVVSTSFILGITWKGQAACVELVTFGLNLWKRVGVFQLDTVFHRFHSISEGPENGGLLQVYLKRCISIVSLLIRKNSFPRLMICGCSMFAVCITVWFLPFKTLTYILYVLKCKSVGK